MGFLLMQSERSWLEGGCHSNRKLNRHLRARSRENKAGGRRAMTIELEPEHERTIELAL